MRRSLWLVFLLAWASSGWAQSAPPAGSPTALGTRPRMFVTPTNQAALRQYIADNYATEFQAFLNRFDDADPSATATVSAERSTLNVWGPANYALPVALGITELQALGFTFPTTHDTAAELCASAYYYATTDIDGTTYRSPVWNLNNNRSVSQNRTISYYLNSTDTTAFYLPTILMYDWCHAELSEAQRDVIADAHWTRYTLKWQGINLLNQGFLAQQATSNRWPIVADDTLFVLAAWGDSDVLDAAKFTTLYETFYTLWINRFIWEVDTLYSEGWFWSEGADYWSYSGAAAINYVIAAIDLALGTTYINRPYFTQVGRATAAWFMPEPKGRTTGCGASGTAPCDAIMQTWGANTYTLGAPSCMGDLMVAGVQRFLAANTTGALQTELALDAQAAEWAVQNYTLVGTPTCEASQLGNNPWATDLWFRYLFGRRGLTAAAPPAKQYTLGAGNYLWRNDYSVNDTQIWVSGVRYTLAHDSSDYGTFTLQKYGPLIVKAAVTRSGDCRVASGGNILKNNVGIHTGASDTTLGSDTTGGAHPDFAARGITNAIYLLATAPSASHGDTYDYVAMDYDLIWNQADVMTREITYLRGAENSEYLVVFDRADVADVANDPIWKIWVPQMPACVDASCVKAATGRWTTTGKVVSVTNQHAATSVGGTTGTAFDLAPTSGKFFLKALLPADATIQMLGDDSATPSTWEMWQDGNADGTLIPFAEATCSTAYYDPFGWGRIEVRPGTVGTTNTFLNVIQFGNSTTLTSMSTTQVAEVSTPAMLVAWIDDPEQTRVVGFRQEDDPSPRWSYRYPQRTAVSQHVLTGLAPDASFAVQVQRPDLGALLLGFVLAPPVVIWRLTRRRKSRVAVVVGLSVLAALAGVALTRSMGVGPVVMTVEIVQGSGPYQSDAAGVLQFTVER